MRRVKGEGDASGLTFNLTSLLSVHYLCSDEKAMRAAFGQKCYIWSCTCTLWAMCTHYDAMLVMSCCCCSCCSSTSTDATACLVFCFRCLRTAPGATQVAGCCCCCFRCTAATARTACK
jgi:hypothetical protein